MNRRSFLKQIATIPPAAAAAAAAVPLAATAPVVPAAVASGLAHRPGEIICDSFRWLSKAEWANLGTITAGVMRSTDGRAVIDFDNRSIVVIGMDPNGRD